MGQAGLRGSDDEHAKAPSNIRSKNTYVFGQDEWHVKKNLVLTLGLRYEYSTPKTDTLRGQCKTGQQWSGQNRPTEVAGD